MTGRLPPLTDLLLWSTEHLTTGASAWDALASRWETSFESVSQRVLNSGWEGLASSAARERTYWDHVTVVGYAGDLRRGAEIARSGASNVDAALERLRGALRSARNIGFEVHDNYAVTDQMNTFTYAQKVQRVAKAHSLAQDILWLAAGLVDVDRQVGDRLAKATASLENTAFEVEHSTTMASTSGAGVELVDLITPMESPAFEPGDPSGPDRGPSAGDIRTVLERLPEGNRPWIREVRTSRDLQRLWKWLEQNGIENPSRYGDPSRGVWVDLPDGSGAGQRSSAGSTRLPAIDINLSGSEHWKVHINPATGGAPDIPAVQRPGEGAAGRGGASGSSAPPSIVDAPADRGAPPPRAVPGGVIPDGTFPHFADAPGPEAGAPDLPVIGDGRPDFPDPHH
jgi:hypothetical protein